MSYCHSLSFLMLKPEVISVQQETSLITTLRKLSNLQQSCKIHSVYGKYDVDSLSVPHSSISNP